MTGVFGAEVAPVQPCTPTAADAIEKAYLDITNLGADASADSDALRSELRTFLRRRFGNHAREVLDLMRMWEVYDELHAAWRDEWTADTPAYRAHRALRFARAGRS